MKGLGAEVVSYDPEAMDTARRAHPQLNYADSLETALAGSEAVVVVTEWKQFKNLDPAETLTKVARPVVFDGRNILNPEAWKSAGWEYRGMGR